MPGQVFLAPGRAWYWQGLKKIRKKGYFEKSVFNKAMLF